ncbi:MAG: 50S ribosomal protein L4 [Gammaproteobacteria bacterium]
MAVSVIGDKTKKIELSEQVFAQDFNEALIHQAVIKYQAGMRKGTKAQKNRSEVSGGGKKPWRQKGTGRARAGTTRGPIWRSGGRAFAAKPRDFSQKLNKKMYRNAIASILSELLRKERLIIADNLELKEIKTKGLIAKLRDYKVQDALIINDKVDVNLYLSARNLPKVTIVDVPSINPVDLISFNHVIITEAAIKQIEEWLG